MAKDRETASDPETEPGLYLVIQRQGLDDTTAEGKVSKVKKLFQTLIASE